MLSPENSELGKARSRYRCHTCGKQKVLPAQEPCLRFVRTFHNPELPSRGGLSTADSER